MTESKTKTYQLNPFWKGHCKGRCYLQVTRLNPSRLLCQPCWTQSWFSPHSPGYCPEHSSSQWRRPSCWHRRRWWLRRPSWQTSPSPRRSCSSCPRQSRPVCRACRPRSRDPECQSRYLRRIRRNHGISEGNSPQRQISVNEKGAPSYWRVHFL